ncbi:MAG: SurA N-terminal domain-containing protein [Bacteroidetes bacterium]|nr:SurA N-terminal domain-containing protein [Bacteroidota bacterium]
MAIIGKIRKRSGLLVIIIGVALAAFVLGDFLKPGKRYRKMNNIGVIAGENIPYTEFAQKAEEQLANMKERSKKDKLTNDEVYQARQMTWTQTVKELVMGEEYDKLGITVSTDELFDLVQGKNPHQYILQYFKDPKTNQYNPQLVINFLKQLDQMEPAQKKNWLMLEKAIKDDRLQTKFNNLLGKAYYMPKVFTEIDYNEKNTKYNIRVVGNRYQNLDDKTITVTDADFQKYYDENKYQYEQAEETRDLEFVTFDLVASDLDRQKIAEEVNQTFNEFMKATDLPAFVNANSDVKYDSTWFKKNKLAPQVDSVMFNSPIGAFIPPYIDNNTYHMARLVDVQMRPDSMKASHILISFKGSAVNDPKITRSKESAKRTADTLVTILKKDMTQFALIAKKLSDDGSNKEKGGELDWFADGAMVGPFNKACLEAKVGELKLVETPFGYHIINLTGKTVLNKKVRVAMLDRRIEPSSQTIQAIFTKASQFASENTTFEAFEKSVTAKGLNKRTADQIRAMESTLPGLTAARNIIQWAYNEDTKKGTVSTVFEVQGSYVVATLKDIRLKGIPPLEQLKPQIEPLVKREKKAEKLIADMKKMGKDLYQVANTIKGKVDTIPGVIYYSPNLPKFGPEPKVIGTLVTLKPNSVSDPIQGEQAVYMIQIDSISPAPKVTDLNMYKQQAGMMFNNRVQMEAYKSLEKIADVEDNRVRFY